MSSHTKDTAKHLTLLASFTQGLAVKLQAVERKVQNFEEQALELRLALRQVTGFPVFFSVKYPSPSSRVFFTHPHGYKMNVLVFPEGVKEGRGTHVSIYVLLMQGPFDDHLKWPFRGNITLQILNQVRDSDHVEKTIVYDDDTPDVIAGRATDSEPQGRGIVEFLPHSLCGYNSSRRTEYMRDNVIIVRIVNAVIT
jgi:TNF receptor-associated factor 4